MKEPVERIRDAVKTRFDASKRVLSFEEFWALAQTNPSKLLRTSAQYLLDAVETFGVEKKDVRGRSTKRYRIFDQKFLENPQPVYGQEAVQSRIVQILTGFVRSGHTNKLVVLHGPNGSSKSSIIRALKEGLEEYSRADDGMMFQFSWIFPNESFEKVGLGISNTGRVEPPTSSESFAKIDQSRIAAIVRSELHENPLLLIPQEDRLEIFDGWWKAAKTPQEKEKLELLRTSFLKSELSHKNTLIFEALLSEYKGDLKKVLRHVRVERLYLSRRFRNGLVSVEPQFGVDATIRQVTLDRSLAQLPPALQSLNLFQLEGDVVDANRGILEYNELLKRPVEHFKYLLGTCESGSVNLAHVVVFLDAVFLATTDDRQLEAFREHPDYPSFKGRIELVKVPYLLRVSDEEQIYKDYAKLVTGPKELMPHTTRCLALWAVLTRLKRPIGKNKSPTLIRVLETLTPLEKAKIYDTGEVPERFADDERREVKSHIEELVSEHQNQPYYEGVLGASARELKVALQTAAQNDQYLTLGPNAIFSELSSLAKRPMDYEFLRLEANQGYHAFEDFIGIVRNEWLDWVDEEMRVAIGFQDQDKIIEFLSRYMQHAIAFGRGEKLRNRITGKDEAPDESLMKDFEENVGMKNDAVEFRRNLITRLGAWSVEHPDRDKAKGLPFHEIFPDLVEAIERHDHEKNVTKIRAMGEVLVDTESFEGAVSGRNVETLSEAAELGVRAYRTLQDKFGYGPIGAKEALVELMKSRYLKDSPKVHGPHAQ